MRGVKKTFSNLTTNEKMATLRKFAANLPNLINPLNPAEIAETQYKIIAYLSYFLADVSHWEREYYREIKDYEVQGMSHASAESRARAGDAYPLFKEARSLYDLMNSLVWVLRHDKERIEQEMSQS